LLPAEEGKRKLLSHDAKSLSIRIRKPVT